MSEHTTKVGTSAVTIRADFSQASSEIMARYSDCGQVGDWEPTGKQVADFRHDPDIALAHFRRELEQA